MSSCWTTAACLSTHCIVTFLLLYSDGNEPKSALMKLLVNEPHLKQQVRNILNKAHRFPRTFYSRKVNRFSRPANSERGDVLQWFAINKRLKITADTLQCGGCAKLVCVLNMVYINKDSFTRTFSTGACVFSWVTLSAFKQPIKCVWMFSLIGPR